MWGTISRLLGLITTTLGRDEYHLCLEKLGPSRLEITPLISERAMTHYKISL